jgi:hypothetical protein
MSHHVSTAHERAWSTMSALHPQVTDVDGIMALLAQPLDDAHIHAHVGRESARARPTEP